MESNGKIGYSAAENNVMNMKPGPLERTWLWKLRNVPPIIFRLMLFSIPIYFFWASWIIDISKIDEMNARSSLLLVRGITAISAIWIIDCLTRIRGFTNVRTYIVYEVFKAIILICFILFIAIILVVMGYYEVPIWYFVSPIGLLSLFPIRKLLQLSNIIKDYSIAEVKDAETIKISMEQIGLDISTGCLYPYISWLNYQITVNNTKYHSAHMLNSIIRHKFSDYKNGKPLKIIYSIKNPKFNIIFQD